MNDELTIEELEDELIAKALKDASFSRSMPSGMADRLRVRIRETVAPRRAMPRWFKIAASLAAVASFAALAATVTQLVAPAKTAEDIEVLKNLETPDDLDTLNQTFEEIFSEELNDITQQEEQKMNSKAIRSIAAGTFAFAATSLAAPSVHGAVRSSVFDDAMVWYRGALQAQSYYSNGPEGTFAANGSCETKAFKSILHTSNASSVFNSMKWAWGWGAETTLGSDPVVCPYANCTLTGVTYANRPIPAKTNDWADVTVNGVTTSQPILSHWKGPEYIKSGAWISEDTSTYTMILRLRIDTPLNNHAGSSTGDGFSIFADGNYSYNGKTGIRISFNGPTLGTYRCPRIFFGSDRIDLSNAQVPYGNWIDLAIAVNGSTATIAACAQGESANTIDWKTVTLSEGVNPSLKAGGNTFTLLGPQLSGGYTVTWTNGVWAAPSSSAENGMRAQFFRGAVHQMAFWNRALSADEIREAWGEGRPNLVRVGVEGNGTAEFAATDTSVSNSGAWQLLNPTLSAENPTATISFNCPALWAGLPQYLRLPIAGASSSGSVSIALNGETLGMVNVAANRTALLYIEDGKILSGENTLVISRVSGDSLVLDAVTLGGSWRFGENINSFANAPSTPDRFLFNPACANDKFHDRTFNSSGEALTEFRFFVPEDMVGKYRGLFATRAQNTGGSVFDWEFLVNGTSFGTYGLKGGNNYEIKVKEDAIIAGWNTLAWKRVSGWVNYDWHKFTVTKPPKGMAIIIR